MFRRFPERFVKLFVLLLAVTTMTTMACGGTQPEEQAAEVPSTSQSVEASPTTTGDGFDALEAVYAEVEGLTGDERRAALIELAMAEGGDLTFYTSTNVDESGPITEAFEEETGIAVNLFRSSAENILQRVLQETDADFAGADVLTSMFRLT